MNVHAPQDSKATPLQEAEVIERLREWLSSGATRDLSDAELRALKGLMPKDAVYPDLNRDYPSDFSVSQSYRSTLPDLQNGPSSLIKGENQSIQHVGISNFRLPLKFKSRGGGNQVLQCSVTGTVSLDADKKGINMSRIMRSFYKHSEKEFSFNVIEAALDDYKSDLNSFDARILLRMSYPVIIPSLRSGLSGYQYYDIALEVIDTNELRSRYLHLDYVYSSTCPCSLELSEHARRDRNQLATPHSQRSVARISVKLEGQNVMWFEDLIDLCRKAVPTETQVMVKREDEQAFAELNAANPIFVEDAVRLFCEQLKADERISDFRVIASHQESLHSHDAVSIMTQGPSFEQHSLSPHLFSSMIHVG